MISVWPAGWVCHAVRAPGSNVTRPPVACVYCEASNSGSMTTEPVKFGAGPLAEGRNPFGVMSMSCPFSMGPPSGAATFKDVLHDRHSRHRVWPARVERNMGQHFRRLCLRQAVV